MIRTKIHYLASVPGEFLLITMVMQVSDNVQPHHKDLSIFKLNLLGFNFKYEKLFNK